MAYRCDRCRYVCQNLQMMVRHMMRHDKSGPQGLTETYNADKTTQKQERNND